MDRHVLLRLLLKIALLLSFASATLPARLQRNSSASPSPYDDIPIGQPVHSPDVTPSLYDIIPFGQLPSSSLSLSQATKVTRGSIRVLPSLSVSPLPEAVPYVLPSPGTKVTRGTIRVPPSPSASASPGASPYVLPSPSLSPAASASPPLSPSPSRSPSPSFNQTGTAGQTLESPVHSPLHETSRGGLKLSEKILIAIAAVIVVSLVILIAVIMAFKKKRAAHNDVGTDKRAYTTGQLANPGGNSTEVGIGEIRTHTVEELNSLEMGIEVRTYTMEELAKATNDFTTQVGQGVSGFVYRANLPGDRMGAVKRAKDLDPILFKQELSVLLRLPRHPHLVDLIGLCLLPGEQILVFEFISNGSLYDRLHKNKDNKGLTSPLSWTARMDIAFQVAVALQYLHEEARPPILHRDVKSANVLLVNDNCVKLADFGLSKLGPKNNEFTVTAVRGSYGYMDPQYVKTRRYSSKSDVYSFGVLLLELITGFKSLHDDTPLAEWTQSYRNEGIEKFMTIVDRNLIDHINMTELQNMVKIANLCLPEISEERPLMREIVNMMQETRNLNAANGSLSDEGEAPFLENGNLSDGGATALC